MAVNTVLRNSKQFLKLLTEGRGFDRAMRSMEVVAASPGKVTCELTLEEGHLNRAGALHGGFTAALVDDVSTLAIMAADKPPGVSVDMNVTYMKAAHLGDVLSINANCLKCGSTLAFAAVDIVRKMDGSLIAQGRQTKHLGGLRPPADGAS